MSDHEVMEAKWVDASPDADGNIASFGVGASAFDASGQIRNITRITVQQDLPGMHCNMRRVCVWVGEHLLFEAPVHNVQGIGYAVPAEVQP